MSKGEYDEEGRAMFLVPKEPGNEYDQPKLSPEGHPGKFALQILIGILVFISPPYFLIRIALYWRLDDFWDGASIAVTLGLLASFFLLTFYIEQCAKRAVETNAANFSPSTVSNISP
jgi:hypothetical protein